MKKIVVIKDMSAGNDTIGETWQETKVFDETATLKEAMDWGIADRHIKDFSAKRIIITRPHD